MTTTNTNTIGASGADYSTIASWESDTDNNLLGDGSGSDSIEVGALLNETHTISSAVTIGGATTDDDHYRILRATTGAEYSPITGAGAVVDQTADTYGFLVSEEGVRMERIGVKHTVATHGGTACVAFLNDGVNANGATVTLTGVVAIDETTTHTGQGFWVITGEYKVVFNNCIAIGKGANSFAYGFRNSGTSPQVGPEYNNCDAYNCTINGFQSSRDIATFKVQNCVSVGAGTADFGLAGTSLAVVSNNASSDATAPGTGAVTGVVPADAFTAPASNDFTLKTGSVLIDAGVDLSAFFTTDLAGNLHGRNGTWEIGAYDFRGYPLTRIAETFAITDREEATMHFTNREEATCRIS